MFANVLVGVDGRQGGRDAIALAKTLTSPGAQITFAHVFGAHMAGGRAAALAMPLRLEASEQLLACALAETGVAAETVSVCESSVGRGLHVLAEQRAVDLLVVGACSRGVACRTFLGDDARSALNGAPCPVAIAPSGYAMTAHPLSRIGVGYDGSPESEQALAAARALAARFGSTIAALSVVSLQSIPYGEPIPPDPPDTEVAYGEPGEAVTSFAEQLDVLIVGSRSYGPVRRLLNGSTSNRLARRVGCPLLVLPGAR